MSVSFIFCLKKFLCAPSIDYLQDDVVSQLFTSQSVCPCPMAEAFIF